jgi:hypothetical protein
MQTQFQTFTSWKQAKDSICKEGAEHKAKLNSFVMDSIYFFHNEGNFQKDILNGVIDTVRAVGLSQRNIVDYLASIVPHKIGRVKTAHDFKYYFEGRKEGEEYLSNDMIAEFIKTNKVWFRYHNENQPKAFNVQVGIATLVKGCFKNGIDYDTALTALNTQWQSNLLAASEKKAAKASR